MNLQNLMKQAQAMQKNIMDSKNAIEKMVFEGKSELVTVKINGKRQVISVKFKENLSLENEDAEILEDMFMIAMNDALKKVDDEIKEKIGNQAGGLSNFL